MKQIYRWGEVAPPAVQAMRQRRRWLMNSPGFKNWRAAPEAAAHAQARDMPAQMLSSALQVATLPSAHANPSGRSGPAVQQG